MIDYGMPTLVEFTDIEENAKLCKELGLKFIEINMNLPQYQPQNIDVKKFLDIASSYGIYYTLHMDENFNACDYNVNVRKAYVKSLKDAVKLAKEIKAPIINIHLHDGVYFTLPHKKVYLFEQNKDEYIKNQHVFLKAMDKELKDSGVKICIENSNGYKSYHKEALEFLMENDNFGLAFDTGHCHISEYDDEGVIMCYPEKLSHFHIHDAVAGKKTKKDHLVLRTGDVSLYKYFNLAEKVGARAVIEVKTVDALKESLWRIKEGR